LVLLARFTRRELIVLVGIGLLTPLIDDRIEHFLVQFFSDFRAVVSIFDYTGGPVNSDLLIAWEQYGAVLAAYLVRKPGAATLAMAVNGVTQVFRDGFVGPHHLFYWVAGLGADVVFAAYRYRRYDAASSALAGIAAQVFWIPFTYAYHVVYVHPISFIEGDLIVRTIGSAVGDGLVGAGIGASILWLSTRAGVQLSSPHPTSESRRPPLTKSRIREALCLLREGRLGLENLIAFFTLFRTTASFFKLAA